MKEVYDKNGKLIEPNTEAYFEQRNQDLKDKYPWKYEKKPPHPKQSEEEKREKRKEYRSRPEVKEKRKIEKHNYYIEHKEEKQQYDKEYYLKNEEKLKSKVECECGSIISYHNKSKHYKSGKHLKFLEEKNK